MPFSLLVNSPYYYGYTNTKTINSAELSIDSITAGDSSAFSDNSEKHLLPKTTQLLTFRLKMLMRLILPKQMVTIFIQYLTVM